MLSGIRRNTALRTSCAVMGGAALIALAAPGTALAAPLAGPGYGPIVPAAAAGSPAFHCVVTSQIVGSRTSTIRAQLTKWLSISTQARSGSLPKGAALTITAPYHTSAGCQGAQIGDGGISGRHALGGAGVLVQVNGSTYTGEFAHPITVHLRSAAIGARTAAVVWDGYGYKLDRSARVQKGEITVSLLRNTEVAILARNANISLTSARTTPESAAQFFSAAFLRGGRALGVGVQVP